MPEPAPVTMATLFSNFPMGSPEGRGWGSGIGVGSGSREPPRPRSRQPVDRLGLHVFVQGRLATLAPEPALFEAAARRLDHVHGAIDGDASGPEPLGDFHRPR